MNYRKQYNQLIENSRQKNRQKGNGVYYEAHHWLPKSMYPQYIKCKWNIVLLTAKEHFIAHRLLNKIFQDNVKLEKALLFMCQPEKYGIKISLKKFQELKENMSNRMKINNPMFNEESKQSMIEKLTGRNLSQDVKDKISESTIGPKNHFFGKSHTLESKKIMSKKQKVNQLILQRTDPLYYEKKSKAAQISNEKQKAKRKESKFMNRNGINKMVHRTEQSICLQEGWIFGMIRNKAQPLDL